MCVCAHTHVCAREMGEVCMMGEACDERSVRWRRHVMEEACDGEVCDEKSVQ